jgi:protein involved in polysaccharide export with SLBB domain
MRRALHLIALIATILITAPGFTQSSAAPLSSTAPAATTATIRPGDAIHISVWRKPELSGEFFVAIDGSIAHPLYQNVKVAGISAEAAAQRVQAFLEETETLPRVRVDPLYRVSVGGQVRQPRLYTLRPEVAISEAIDMAGGPTERGRLDRALLYRDGSIQYIDLSGSDPTVNEMRIQSGDRIIVERRRNIFREAVVPLSVMGSIASIVNVWIRWTR